MATVIEMPKLSDTMEDGTIANWLKTIGDYVDEGEALVEIETDKATMEYQSPEEGYLLHIALQTGETANLNAPLAVLGDKDEQLDLDTLFNKKTTSQPTSEAEPPETSEQLTALTTTATTTRKRSSPLARKVAAQRGIDLQTIQGSGPRGRIVAKDLDIKEVGEVKDLDRPITSRLSNMRRTIAKRLVQATQQIPHYYLKRSANLEQLANSRQQIADRLQQKISLNSIIAFMCIKALQKHPRINSSWAEDGIIEHQQINLAIAVAVDDGLITPVVANSGTLDLFSLDSAIKDLAQKARKGQLAPHEYTDGTFTISNLGMYGIEEFTAIINPPQAAILAIGAAFPTPVVADDGTIVKQLRASLTLSSDHRLIDGAVGAQFLATLVNYLEYPLMAILR